MTRDEVLKKQKQYLFPSVSNYYKEPLVADTVTKPARSS